MDLVTLANNNRILDFGRRIRKQYKSPGRGGDPPCGGRRKQGPGGAPGSPGGPWKTDRVPGDVPGLYVLDWAAGPDHPGVFSTYDPARALEAIKTARGQCDYLVVCVHWGVERETEPKDYQRAMGRQYIDAGADLVIGKPSPCAAAGGILAEAICVQPGEFRVWRQYSQHHSV